MPVKCASKLKFVCECVYVLCICICICVDLTFNIHFVLTKPHSDQCHKINKKCSCSHSSNKLKCTISSEPIDHNRPNHIKKHRFSPNLSNEKIKINYDIVQCTLTLLSAEVVISVAFSIISNTPFQFRFRTQITINTSRLQFRNFSFDRFLFQVYFDIIF